MMFWVISVSIKKAMMDFMLLCLKVRIKPADIISISIAENLKVNGEPDDNLVTISVFTKSL